MKTFTKISLILFLVTIIFAGSLFAQTNNPILKTNDLTDSLIAYYPFNGNADDESGNGNNAINEGATLSEDRFGEANSAFHFDGTDDYINIGNNIKPDLPATVSGWVYFDSLNYSILFRNDRTDGCSYYNGLQVETADGRLTGWIGCGYAAPSTRRHKSTNDTVFTQKTWHHFSVVYADYNTINLYVDGKEYDGDWGNGTGSKIRYSDSYNGALGMRNTCGENQYFFSGSLDDIRVYNRSLSENEVNELYYENGWGGGHWISLTTPQGGENWTTGSQHEITWTAGDSIKQVKIEYSDNGGSSWVVEPASVEASAGSYLWTTPDVVSDDYLIKISKAEDAEVFDESGVFRTYIPETVIITHGFTLEVGGDDLKWKKYKWQFSMADAIDSNRQILLVRKGEIYQTNMTYNDLKWSDDDMLMDDMISNSFFYSKLDLDKSRNTAIVFDWIEESDIITHGYAEAAADVLSATIIKLAQDYPWIVRNIHFIGHSRGTVVNSEAIQRLIYFASEDILPDNVQTEFDKSIHMTTLDAHPAGHWTHIVSINDDWVNSKKIKVYDIEKGYNVRAGVSGWKAGEYKVGYIDNFYETIGSTSVPITFYRGLNNIPGSQINVKLDDYFYAQMEWHSLVHTWYNGTVDGVNSNESFGDGKEYKREKWYSDNLGRKQGFFYSDIRSKYLNSIKSNQDELYNVTSDENYGEDYLVFNGDFEKSRCSSPCGWKYQNGGGTGAIGNDFGTNACLLLYRDEINKIDKDIIRHNHFYIPKNIDNIYFRMRVVVPSNDDRLITKIGDEVISDIGLWDISNYYLYIYSILE